MENRVETIIVGATYFGVGYAAAHPGCLILEASEILGGDFHHSARAVDQNELSEEETGTELGQLMKEYHILENGRFDVLKSILALHEYVSRHKEISILLNVNILSIESAKDGYRVTYSSNEGIHTVFCNRIIDTTVRRATCPEGAVCRKKSLNLFTVCTSEQFDSRLTEACPDCVVTAGMYPGERLVKIPFDAQEKLLDAYGTVTELWKKAFPCGEEKILFIAQDFDYVCERTNEESAPYVWNGGRFPHPLIAFAKGVNAE